jgi:site-specific recombinase XerD
MQEASGKSLIPRPANIAASIMPACINQAGAAATFAWEEYFLGKLRNTHTRTAYMRAVRRFLNWAERQNLQLPNLTPGMVGRYFDELPLSVPSKKLHLAAIRAFFDVLVQRHVIVLNPSLSVRMERYSVMEGKTPEITVEQSRRLLASIKLESLIDLRDRAIIATLIYTAARAGAVAKLRIGDLVPEGAQLALRFAEKGGKSRSIPVRHDLQEFLQAYLFAGGLDHKSSEGPLFRTIIGRTGKFSERRLSGGDVWRIVKARLRAAGLTPMITCHSLRACAATDLLFGGVALEDVQHLLGHSDSRVTKLYDRRRRQITRNIVERISV